MEGSNTIIWRSEASTDKERNNVKVGLTVFEDGATLITLQGSGNSLNATAHITLRELIELKEQAQRAVDTHMSR